MSGRGRAQGRARRRPHPPLDATSAARGPPLHAGPARALAAAPPPPRARRPRPPSAAAGSTCAYTSCRAARAPPPPHGHLTVSPRPPLRAPARPRPARPPARACRDNIKSIVFGGLDGVITTFSTIASVAGAALPIETVLVLGFANLIADGIAMGAGDFLSSKAEFDFLVDEKAKSAALLEGGRGGADVAAALEAKGLSAADAAEVVAIVSKPAYREFGTEFVLVEKFEQEVPDDPWGPAKDGAVTFVSFLFFGSLPLWVYVITYGAKYKSAGGSFGISAAACALSLFALGVLQGAITKQPRVKAGLYMTVNGTLAGAAAYALSYGITAAIGNGC